MTMQRPTVLVVGEALVEFVREGPGELGEPGRYRGPFPSGAPAIAADAAALAGAEVLFVSTVGDDAFGRLVVDRLGRDGVDLGPLRTVAGATTGTAFVAYRADGSRSFVFHAADAAPGRLTVEDLGDAPERADVLHVSGASLALSSAMAGVILVATERVRAAGGCLSVEANLRPDAGGNELAMQQLRDVMSRADTIVASADEAPALADELAAARARGATVCVTLGPDGATLVADGTEHRVRGLASHAVDPTGAGDTFAGVLITALTRGDDPEQALAAANAAGAAHVAAWGPMERAGWPS
jgi:tagatose kinase